MADAPWRPPTFLTETPVPDIAPPAARRAYWKLALLILVPCCIAAYVIHDRVSRHALLQQSAAGDAILAVVVTPKTGPGHEELVLPGELQPYVEAPVYARASGYLKRRLVELGAPVKAGELLAEIDSPELDQQLKQAEADLATAVANDALAQVTARRWQELLASGFVSKQDADQKTGEATAKQTLVHSAQANVDRLRELEKFKRVTAPFDGIITARKTDIGALITAGSGTGPELFHVADMHRLRVLVRVPQAQALLVQPGQEATLQSPEHPGKAIPAKLVRTSGAIDPDSHSLLAELEADNTQNTLLPGAYTEVHIPLPSPPGSVRIPSSALLFGSEGLRVAIVGDHARTVLKPVVLGRDFGKQVEILDGLAPDDRVISNPADSIGNDQPVQVVAGTTAGSAGGK